MTNRKRFNKLSFFKDTDGCWALWQWPNIPLYGWLASKLLSLAIEQQHLHTGLVHLSTAFLFTWCFLEITQGVNYFRRLLGVTIMSGVIVGYFQ
jgi:hypothetical protein